MTLDVTTGAIAKRDLTTIDEKRSVLDASRLMVERGLGSVMVTRNDERVGILTERDVLKKVVARSLNASSTKIRDVMSSPPITIEHDRPLREAIDQMNRKGVRRMLVTERGRSSEYSRSGTFWLTAESASTAASKSGQSWKARNPSPTSSVRVPQGITLNARRPL